MLRPAKRRGGTATHAMQLIAAHETDEAVMDMLRWVHPKYVQTELEFY